MSGRVAHYWIGNHGFANGGNVPLVVAWWTGPCGAMHVETDPTYIGACPDGLVEGQW